MTSWAGLRVLVLEADGRLAAELPGANGFAVCNKLKKDERTRDIPLILLSSEESEETFAQHRQLRTRAEAYLHKPFAFEQLRQEIEARVAHLGRELAARQAERREGAGVPYRGAGVPATVPTGHKSEPTAVDRTWSVVSVLVVVTAALFGARSGLFNERLGSGGKDVVGVDAYLYLAGGAVGAVAGVVLVGFVWLIVRGYSSLLARARHGPG